MLKSTWWWWGEGLFVILLHTLPLAKPQLGKVRAVMSTVVWLVGRRISLLKNKNVEHQQLLIPGPLGFLPRLLQRPPPCLGSREEERHVGQDLNRSPFLEYSSLPPSTINECQMSGCGMPDYSKGKERLPPPHPVISGMSPGEIPPPPL